MTPHYDILRGREKERKIKPKKRPYIPLKECPRYDLDAHWRRLLTWAFVACTKLARTITGGREDTGQLMASPVCG